MRILGFSQKWLKLTQPEFTTFRFTRRDKDWQVGEVIQIVYKPRSKEREMLGNAGIISKESKVIPSGITENEAVADGFTNCFEMWLWLLRIYGRKRFREPMNKLTLRRIILPS